MQYTKEPSKHVHFIRSFIHTVFQFFIGLKLGTGEFKVTCTGIHVILATLIMSSAASTNVDVRLIVDGMTTYNVSSKYITSSSLSMHVSVILNLNESQSLQLWITSNPVTYLQLSKWSTFSIWNINPLSATLADYSRIVTEGSIDVPTSGAVTSSLTQSLGTSQVNTSFYTTPVSITLQSGDNNILCSEAKLYLALVSLRLKVVSWRNFTVTSKLTVGSASDVLSSSTTLSDTGHFYETMTTGTVLKCDKRKTISVSIEHATQVNESVSILEGSSLALIEARQAYPELVAAKNQGDTVEFPVGGGVKELNSWSILSGSNYREGKHFNQNTGRFTADKTGIYYVSTNVEYSATSAPSTSVSLSIAVNGVAAELSPITKYLGEPSDVETLSISGLLKLEKDQHVSVFIQSPGATGKLTILGSSGFFVAHMGQASLIPAFSAYLTNEIVTSDTTINIVSSNLTTNSDMFQYAFLSGEWVRNDESGTFAAPLAGTYIVSCTALLNNTAPSSNVAYYELRIVGSNIDRRGMFHEWYSKASSARNFFTLSTSGVVNLASGDIIGCQLTNGKSGSIRVTSAVFSAALLQYSGSGIGFNTYIKDPSVFVDHNDYALVDKYTTAAGFPYFETDANLLVESNGRFTADRSGVLFISGNIGICCDADSDKTYLAQLKTEVESNVTYSDKIGITSVVRGLAPKIALSFAGLYEMSVGTVTSLVVKAVANDPSWRINSGSGWSLYTFPNNSPRQPGVLDGRTSSDQPMKGAPYFSR